MQTTVVAAAEAEAKGAPFRIGIADDHALFRQGMRALLRQERDMELVVDAERVDDIAASLARAPCDILLLDLRMDRHALAEIRPCRSKRRWSWSPPARRLTGRRRRCAPGRATWSSSASPRTI